MLKINPFYAYLCVLVLLLSGCESDDAYQPINIPPPVVITPPDEESPVVFDIDAVPYQNLSDYNFYEGNLKDLNPVYGVLPYNLKSTLYTDYAKKQRFIWMPDDVKASYVSDYQILDFPVGTVLIKNFYYDNVLPSLSARRIETRLIIKKEDGWIFADYVWNNEQTEAVLDLQGSFTEVEWMEGSNNKTVNYRIPHESECLTCHKLSDQATPIGVKPQNLDRMVNYGNEMKNQLQKWVEFGYLEDDIPERIDSVVDYNDTSQPIDLRARAYLDINCAHCHSNGTHCDYRPMRLAYIDTEDPTNLGVCVSPDTTINEDLQFIVTPSLPDKSVLFFRIGTTLPQYRMPLLGRTLVDEEGLSIVEEWIRNLNINCD